MAKASRKRALVMPSAEENRRIAAAAMADPDAKLLTKAQLKAMVSLKRLRRALAANAVSSLRRL
jgi:hypothetical protein